MTARGVNAYEELFSDLDAGVAALERVRANLERYRASVLKAAVKGKLTEDWQAQHPDTEPASVLLERILTERRRRWEKDQLAKFSASEKQPPEGWRSRYPAPASPVQEPAEGIPESWTASSLDQITQVNRPICYGILMPKDNVADGVLYVKVKDIKGDKIDLGGLQRTSHSIAEQYGRASLKAGDLLLSIRGTYGRVAEVPCELEGGNITQDTARISLCAQVERSFVAYSLRSQRSQNYFKSVARGVAVKGVNIRDVKPCTVLLAPLEEQKVIIGEVERRLSIVDEIEAQVDANLKRAARLLQGILKRAFEGRLVPQDPNDEPADRLLARIREQRQAKPAAAKGSPRTRPRGRRRNGGPTLPMFPEGEGVRE